MTLPRPAICVFAGSTMPTDLKIIALAQELGQEIADEDLRLVYGGGREGLIGIVARTAFNAKADVRAVLCRDNQDEEQIDDVPLSVVANESARYERYIREENVQGFFVLPGGYGTALDTMIALKKATKSNGPPVVFAACEQLGHLREWFNNGVSGNAISDQYSNTLKEWNSGQSLRATLNIKAPYGFNPGASTHTG